MHQKIPQLIRDLFHIQAAEDSSLLKNKAMSFVRNGLITTETEQGVQREQHFITSEQGRVQLYNVLLLSAFFPDTKLVKEIFSDTHVRKLCADEIRSLFLERQSLLGITLTKPATHQLVESLLAVETFDLKQSMLPNPFETLPQLALGKNIPLMQALLAQSASLDSHDSLLSAYLREDWEEAAKLCEQFESLGSLPESCYSLVETIKTRYQEAQEFDDLIDLFKQR